MTMQQARGAFFLPFQRFTPASRCRSSRLLHSFSFVHLDDKVIEQRTMDWVKRIVVGWNLCPFADKPLREGNLKVHVVRGTDEVLILTTVLDESKERCNEPGTTLVVAPECCPNDFEGYLSYVATLEEELMPENDLDGIIQIAPFHPLFEFNDSSSDGIDTLTNRSPFPIFHILREEEVSKAVQYLDGDASKVYQRNIDLLFFLEERLGTDIIDRAVRGGTPPHDTGPPLSSEIDGAIEEAIREYNKLRALKDDV